MGGSSSSSSSNQTSTTNVDKRQVVSGGTGVSADNSTIHVSSLDGGAIQGAADIAKSALDTISTANAANSTNYEQLLNTTGDALVGMFKLADMALSGGFKSVGDTQQAMAAAIDTANSKGTLDNRTITILGVSTAVAVAAYAMRKA